LKEKQAFIIFLLCAATSRHHEREDRMSNISNIKVKRAARESAHNEAATQPAKTASTPQPEAAPTPPPFAAAAPATASMKPVASTGAARSADMFAYGQQSWAALAEAQAAAVRGFEALLGEMTSFTRSEMAAAAHSATAMLGAKNFTEAVEVNLGYARRSFDALIGSAAKMSEIGAKAAAEASKPMLSRFENGKSFRAG
jgi:hypothetical protein